MNLEPGALFCGRYEVIRSLGAGGMGAVYLACDPKFRDFMVALKVLYPGVIRTREARERFRNEIVASYRVNHKNVVRAYEYFDEEEFQAYAMEHVDGGDLSERMRRGRFEWKAAVEILQQIASGLEAIHAAGIVHRDLKPENILLTTKGGIKISDFGVARLKGSITLTQAGAMVGTPKYVSPEYVETGECDHRGDIYAVGVIAYEMLSGRSPFRSESRVSLMMERFKGNADELYRLVPDCPPEVIEVVKKAMSVDLLGRYQTATELREDLDFVSSGQEPKYASKAPAELVKRISDARSRSPAMGVPVDDQVGVWKSLRSNILAHKSAAVALVSVLLVSIGVSSYVVNKANGPSLLELPDGRYEGTMAGVLSDDTPTPFVVWRTAQGAFLLLGRFHCSMQDVGDNEFECGDLQFQLVIDSVERRSAVGRVRETSWGTKGTFVLKEIRGEP